MKKILVVGALLNILLLTGCIGTNLTVDQSYAYRQSDSFSYEINDNAKVTPKGMSIFKNRLDAKLDEFGLSASAESNKVIVITFTNYYMRHGAARALAGVMAGADNITTTVIIKDAVNGDIVGKLQVMSKNPTAISSARGLIERHADKIATYIKTGKV